MLDENVASSVKKTLEKLGCEVDYIRESIPHGSVDPLVAFVSEKQNTILISHDGDFKKIAPRIPDGQKTRFRTLSRIQLRCEEYKAAQRIESVFDFIQYEFEISKNRKDQRMIIQIGSTWIRSER